MLKAVLLMFASAVVLVAGTVDFVFESAGVIPVGGWGENLSSGLAGGLYGNWFFSPKFRAGLGVDGVVFGGAREGDVSFTQMKPQGLLSLYFRPQGRVFNPGIVAAFGYCRSHLSSGEGRDPASWDPFWRAGIRWGFSIGLPWRAGLGLDLESVMAPGKTGDSFRFTFGVSREVQL